MVFKEMVDIEAEPPFLCVEIKTRHPTAQTVSSATCIVVVNSIFSSWYKCSQHAFNTSLLMNDIIGSAI